MVKNIIQLAQKLFQYPIFFLRKNKISWTSRIGLRSVLLHSKVGKYTYVGAEVYASKTTIGNYCSIAAGTKIGGAEHPWWWGSTSLRLAENFDNFENDKETIISDDVWLGSNVSVRQGVHIGRGAVVGANAVVLTDISPYSIVAGVPAKEIRKRFPDNVVKEIEKTKFWEFPPQKAKELLKKIDYPKVR